MTKPKGRWDLFMSGIMSVEKAAKMLRCYADQVEISRVGKVHVRVDLIEYRPTRQRKAKVTS